MLAAYRQQTAERAALGIPPLPLTADQTRALTDLLMVPPPGRGRRWWTCSPTGCPPGWTRRPR